MSETSTLNPATTFDPVPRIATALELKPAQVQTTVELLNEGATVPFIARYRKDRTNGLDEVQILAIEEQLAYWRELEERRQSILKSINEQGKLTPGLQAQIAAVTSKTELEDLYLPYKPRRRTRAQIARERGLEQLALAIRLQSERRSPSELAAGFLGPEVADFDAALAGARDILAEDLAETAQIREMARQSLWKQGMFVSKQAKGVSGPTKFEGYYDFQEAVARIPSHRYLALRRGEKEKVLKLKVDIEAGPLLDRLAGWLRIQNNAWGEQLRLALEDSWQRLLLPSLETEILAELKTRADATAIDVFAANLQEILMAAPFGARPVLGLDPGLRTGIKCVALSPTGQYLEDTVLYTVKGDRSLDQARTLLLGYIRKYAPAAIAIGDGTGSREAEEWARGILKDLPDPPIVVRVSESGASIYSASEIARNEFPELDLTVRGAISIGRRLQDPLAELVKIAPKSLGVGQYQHDVEQKALTQRLDRVVESSVNRVGVELNTASAALLERVSGLGPKLAKEIVARRDAEGPFASRTQLKKVKGLGPKAFEQAAGFLRIAGAKHALDRTAVHPENYGLVERIAKDLSLPLEQLLAQPQTLDRVDWQRYASAEAGKFTLADIREELKKPGRDPRQSFEAPVFRDDVKELSDVKPGMEFEGRVTNITAFGAFVDIGVHQDGLVHVSQLANRFVKDPHEVVRVGQTLKVKVLEVDPQRKRIQLTAKG
ncbi:MAG: Tex family protein [Candidatus Sericytochromatia bacterium]